MEDCPTVWEEDPSTKGPRKVGASTYPGLNAEIERASQYISSVNIPDDEDSIGYSKETLEHAVEFLTAHLLTIWLTYGIKVPVPRIGPGPGGSVDLHWKQSSWELLVNISPDPNAPASFYGDDYGNQRIRGSLDTRGFNLGIATWLMG